LWIERNADILDAETTEGSIRSVDENRPFSGLMEDLRRGDPDAAREVFDRFARRLAGLAAARLPGAVQSKVDPEDVAQSVLRTFFRRHQAGEFRPDHWDALWSLLAVLAARKCGHQVSHLLAAKRDARREVVSGSAKDESAPKWEPSDPGFRGNARSRFCGDERARTVDRATEAARLYGCRGSRKSRNLRAIGSPRAGKRPRANRIDGFGLTFALARLGPESPS
jgi:hypothetical protein